jgi:hypothetical protein
MKTTGKIPVTIIDIIVFHLGTSLEKLLLFYHDTLKIATSAAKKVPVSRDFPASSRLTSYDGWP